MSNPNEPNPTDRLRPMTAVELRMHEDMRWAMEHHAELDRQYHGQSVVVWNKQVVAHGVDEAELLRQAATPERPAEQLVIIEFPEFFESPH